MGNSNFDQRYPAMFQPGGEDHPAEQYFPEALPQPPLPRPPATGASIRAATAPTVNPFGSQRVSEVFLEPPVQAYQADGDEELFPAPINEAPTAPYTRRVSQWSARSWIICSLAIMLVFAGSTFCFFATFLIPSSLTTDATAFHGMLVVAWGQVIFPGGPALLAAGLGMLAAMFLLAARSYPRLAWRLQGTAGLAALVAIGLGSVGLFAERLFTELLYSPGSYQSGSNPLPWYSVFSMTASLLLILGPIMLALVVVLPPGRKGAPRAPAPKTTFWTGALITAIGVWAWFSPQLFPLARGVKVSFMEGQTVETQPWTYSLSQAGAPIIFVGTLVLFWWVLILATTHAVTEEDHAEANTIPADGE